RLVQGWLDSGCGSCDDRKRGHPGVALNVLSAPTRRRFPPTSRINRRLNRTICISAWGKRRQDRRTQVPVLFLFRSICSAASQLSHVSRICSHDSSFFLPTEGLSGGLRFVVPPSGRRLHDESAHFPVDTVQTSA